MTTLTPAVESCPVERTSLKPLHVGRIVWACVPDKNGHRKNHPAVIARISTNEDGSKLYHIVAISHTFDKPHPTNQIDLPIGTPGTELWEDSVIVCDWIPPPITEDQIIRRYGVVPIEQMRIMAHLLKSKN
jgi:hypothetical protein